MLKTWVTAPFLKVLFFKLNMLKHFIVIYLYVCMFVYWDRVSLICPRSHSVYQAGLVLRDLKDMHLCCPMILAYFCFLIFFLKICIRVCVSADVGVSEEVREHF